MIKTEYQEVVETHRKSVPVDGFCDVCQHRLEKINPDYYNYFVVTTHHYDWGNDSCESYEHFDICSIDCLQKFVSNFWKKHFEVTNTHEMEINTYRKLRKDD